MGNTIERVNIKKMTKQFSEKSFWYLSPSPYPDLNACENLGAIVKDRVEKRLAGTNEHFDAALTRILGDLEFDTQLFISLLESYPARLEAVKKAGGGHTKYW